ncbi:hypothetical protein FJT64_025299 [Amphibalanus amphitrite]|uniref:Uncharacterized protein n=1 Tax=Amphibalanus amphitrite TaxID=1232801 RepID=A0A6A4WBQ0_AMPAM|nr:hypothetical protein FJT64_025299 [Amphibalanus amphitrite]
MTYVYPSIVELVVGGPTDATSTWYSSCPLDTAVSGMAQSNRTLRFIRCTPLPAGVTLDSAAVQVVSHSTWSDTLVCPAGSVVTALGCPADQAPQMTWEQQPFQARLLRCVALVPRPSWSSDTCSLLTLAASQLDTRAGCPYGRLFISLHVYTEGWSVKCCLT